MGNCISQQVEFNYYMIWDFEYNGQWHLANDERIFIKKYNLKRRSEYLIKLSSYVCQRSMGGIFLIAWFFVSIKIYKKVFFASVIFFGFRNLIFI